MQIYVYIYIDNISKIVHFRDKSLLLDKKQVPPSHATRSTPDISKSPLLSPIPSLHSSPLPVALSTETTEETESCRKFEKSFFQDSESTMQDVFKTHTHTTRNQQISETLEIKSFKSICLPLIAKEIALEYTISFAFRDINN